VRHHSQADPIGLHLNFELRLPASATRESVIASLTALHAFAQSLPFADVSPLLTDHDGDSVGESEHAELRSALRQWAELIATPFDADDADDALLAGDASSALGFLVQPGKGCETATFGFLRRRSAAGTPVDWFWHCSCKTQYASTVSEAHLIACHTALVRLLDHAIALGVGVVVRDETHYWESRDVSRLVSEVRAMNQLVARIAGRISDALGETSDVRASIFEHPLFERLEMGNPSSHLRAQEPGREKAPD
jgi:hypothetical protein